jgi:hypothetical protein
MKLPALFAGESSMPRIIAGHYRKDLPPILAFLRIP